MYAYGVFTGSDKDHQTRQREHPKLQLTKTSQRMRVAAGFTENGLCVHSPHPFPCGNATGQVPASAGTMKSTYWQRYLWTSFLNSWNIQHCIVCMCSVSKLCPTLSKPMDCGRLGFLCPWDFPGKNTRVGCHFLLQGIFPPRDRTCVSCVSCIAGGFFTTEPPEKPVQSLCTPSLFFPKLDPTTVSLVEHCKGLFLGAMLKGTADYRLPSHTHQDGGMCSRLKRRWAGYLQNSHKLKALQLYSRPEQFPPISIYPNFISKYILLNHLRGTNSQILSFVRFSLGMGLCCSTLIRKLNGRDLDACGGVKIPPKRDQY